MITEETLNKLGMMKLHGMESALRSWIEKTAHASELTPLELVGMLVDAEYTHRENKKLSGRLRTARFREQACVEEIDWKHSRGVARSQVMELVGGQWLRLKQNVIVTGPTGIGKTFLSCALGNKFCRDGNTVMFRRASRLFDELKQARGDGTYHGVLKRIAKAQLLVIDDFGLEPLDPEARHDLLEILEDRYGVSSTLVTSQLPTDKWHALLKENNQADSILDRLIHNARRLNLTGESLRKTRGQAALTSQDPSDK